MKKLLLFLICLSPFVSNAQNSVIHKKSGEKVTIIDWEVFPNGPKSKFPYYTDDKAGWTEDQKHFTYPAPLMLMKEIDSITTNRGLTYIPYTLPGEKFTFLATVVARSADHTMLLGYHRRGTTLHNRSFNYKFIDNKTNAVLENYIYKDYAGDGELELQEKVFASARKYFGNCGDLMAAIENSQRITKSAKKHHADKFNFSFLHKKFDCD